MSWLTDNFPTALIVLGFALLALEVGVFGFSVFILCFVGLAALVSGFLMWLGVLPATVSAALGAVAVLSLVFAFALWKPLKRMQNSGGAHHVKGDFIGHRFVLAGPASPLQYSSHRLSGVDWKVRADSPLAAGTLVEVVKVEVGELTVAAAGVGSE